ncbi:MAG TPA: hypothetical protein VFJ20_12375 [Gemmatimonadaceae bacterium]|nr:hypothetical protein [Gemmatimonadaceae bacterium]
MSGTILIGFVVWLVPIAIAIFVIMQLVAIRKAMDRMANALEALAVRDVER